MNRQGMSKKGRTTRRAPAFREFVDFASRGMSPCVEDP
jgi:uncharacterized membrane protein